MSRALRRWWGVALLGLGAAMLRPAVAHAQPSPPVGPQSRAVCDAHKAAWQGFVDGIVARHEGCLSATKAARKGQASWYVGTCDFRECQELHDEMEGARADMSRAYSQCLREVADYERRKKQQEAEEKKRREEAERKKRELEEDLKRRQEEAERLRKQEEERRQREEADEKRRQEADEQKAEDQQERDRQAQEAEDARRRDQEARDQAVRDEQERERKAEADRVAAEEQARRDQERKDELDKAFDRAAEQARREFEAFARRTRQRAQAIEQTGQQAAALAQQAGERLASHAGAISKTIEELRKAVSDWSGSGSSAPQKTVDDLMGQFDMEQLRSASSDGEREPMAQAIHDLIDRTKVVMPHRAVEMEYVRSIFDEAYGGPERLAPIFEAIGNMEDADPRAADEFVDGYTMRVFGPANSARIFASVYGADSPAAQLQSTREVLRRVEAAYEARDPRALLRPAHEWMAGDERMVSWWAEDALMEPQIARDRRGMPIIVGPDGKPVGYDDEADRVSYGFDDIPALLEERGARLLRRGDPVWARTGVLFAPYARPMETPQAAAQDMRGWLAGEMVGVAIQGGHP